jgi:FMN phosphatase YigB (HAD superfamily)
MHYNINDAIGILQRTPAVLRELLKDQSDEWTKNNEGPDTWSPYDVIGHLIHGEHTDWPERMLIILSDKPDKTFKPFDRFAQFRESEGQSLEELLEAFAKLREKNLELLKVQNITEEKLQRKGMHPVFGEVTLSQLLSTWVAHDLNHLSQISRVMASQYAEAVGPWIEYLPVLSRMRKQV